MPQTSTAGRKGAVAQPLLTQPQVKWLWDQLRNLDRTKVTGADAARVLMKFALSRAAQLEQNRQRRIEIVLWLMDEICKAEKGHGLGEDRSQALRKVLMNDKSAAPIYDGPDRPVAIDEATLARLQEKPNEFHQTEPGVWRGVSRDGGIQTILGLEDRPGITPDEFAIAAAVNRALPDPKDALTYRGVDQRGEHHFDLGPEFFARARTDRRGLVQAGLGATQGDHTLGA